MIKQVISASRFPLKIWSDTIDTNTIQQMVMSADMPFIHKWISLMPDAHKGIGCSVGAVLPTHKAIIPGAVGVDLGCGMLACKTSLTSQDLPENIHDLRHSIERDVPLGPGAGRKTAEVPDYYYNQIDDTDIHGLVGDFIELSQINDKVKNKGWMKQLGSLGSGNHFIELCLDQNDNVWIMLHSGSRGIGNLIAQHYIALAKKDMEQWFIKLPHTDLAYFPEHTPHFDEYVRAVDWCQRYASINRRMMFAAIIKSMVHFFPHMILDDAIINCHHNYVEREGHYGKNVWVTRKGAIRARKGDWGIIPGSMGAQSFIVQGKGNEESFHSCSHGAGRKMSRTEARKTFTVEDLIEQTKGVECPKGEGVIDEIPGAYKNIHEVMANQTDLVDIRYTLKQFLNIKGAK